MTDSAVLGATGAAAADARQGGYFRAVLAAERAVACAELVRSRDELVRSGGLDDSGLQSRRAAVRLHEREVEYLDALIAALEARFAPQW